MASIAFPLLAKVLLSELGCYELAREDEVRRNAFERFADVPNFLTPPADQNDGTDTHWQRVRQHTLHALRVAAAVQAFEEIRDGSDDIMVNQLSRECFYRAKTRYRVREDRKAALAFPESHDGSISRGSETLVRNFRRLKLRQCPELVRTNQFEAAEDSIDDSRIQAASNSFVGFCI